MFKLFYIIYNSYYKHGNYRKDIPKLTVFGIFLVFTYSLIVLIFDIGKIISDPHTKNVGASSSLFYLIVGTAVLLVYLLFFNKEKYKMIYEKYKDDTFLNSKKAKVIGFFTIIFVILAPMILWIVRNKIAFGYWV